MKENFNMVKWGDIKDRHVEGICEFGKVYIRLNKEEKVTAMYTIFGTTRKLLPEEPWMEDLDGAQLALETQVSIEAKAREWSSELRS